MPHETDDIPPKPKLQYPPGSPERLRKLAEIGAKATATWESIDGVGKDWGTDEEFEAFLEHLRRSRKGPPP